ncbi:MAG: dynamin family protein [Methyloligellaceae bacterium]
MITNPLTIGREDHEKTRLFLQQLDAAMLHLESKLSVHESVETIVRALRRVRMKLARPLRLAIAGELNAGKTTFSNVLIGNTTLPTRAISNTRIPTLIRYSEKPEIMATFNDGSSRIIRQGDFDDSLEMMRLDVGLPNKLLRSVEVLDCPGLSDPHILPNNFSIAQYHVDAAVWCTSGTGPWRKSEEDSWLAFPERIRNRSLLIVTRKDKLDEDSQHKILLRLRHEVKGLFNEIVFMSSTDALHSYEIEMDPLAVWRYSGGQELDLKLSTLIARIQDHRYETAKIVTDRLTNKFLKLLS